MLKPRAKWWGYMVGVQWIEFGSATICSKWLYKDDYLDLPAYLVLQSCHVYNDFTWQESTYQRYNCYIQSLKYIRDTVYKIQHSHRDSYSSLKDSSYAYNQRPSPRWTVDIICNVYLYCFKMLFYFVCITSMSSNLSTSTIHTLRNNHMCIQPQSW